MKNKITVEQCIESSPWHLELSKLRAIFQKTELEETVKWGAPYYILDGKNIAAMLGFKDYFAIWFNQGVFLKDPHKVLMNAQEGVTKGLRQWRFQSMEEINEPWILAYIQEACENHRKGMVIKPEKKIIATPKLLTDALKANRNLELSFNTLSQSKKNDFSEYIGAAKTEETQLRRLEKCIKLISQGIGLNDKYK